VTLARWTGRALLAGLGVLFALHVAWAVRHADDLRPVGGGARAPAFALPLAGGGAFQLAPGRPTLIDFWASWCDPCKAEMPTIARLADRYRGRADVVAVNIEPPGTAAAEAFLRAHPGPLFALGGAGVADLYHVDTIPHLVVVGADGTVRRVFIGPASDGEIAAELDRALPAGR
jgi:cytochrome c biogenesis protein CcmG/thiol:disulfide interchange protein DsbE